MRAVLFLVFAAIVGFLLGDGYIPRLPHHEGYFLVPVHDEVHVPLASPPRRTVFILVDGLRRDSAETMAVTRTLAAAGQCRVSDQGSWTVSRPVYALLSTGLEADRTGARNNEQTAPLAAQSIWEVARKSGLRVSGSSHLPWFGQLFPDGFDRYVTANSHADDVFDGAELLDVNLFHPLYVDEAGHQHGAASSEYAAAVARADLEIAPLLAKVDLARDLVVLTADHGHRAQGGHGGAQPEIKDVLLCFAGKNVARRTDRAPFDGRSVAPALALLLGLPFPRDMRAGDDALDAIFELPDFGGGRGGDGESAYLADRHAAIDHYREENRVELTHWLGSEPGTWPRLYEREAGKQDVRRLLVVVVALGFFLRRVAAVRARGGRAAVSAAWILVSMLVSWGVHHAILGDFDFTVINLRATFVPRAFAIVIVSAGIAAVGHGLVVRDLAKLLADVVTLVGLMLIANVGHVIVYGWPLGFPLPSAAARYFPFFGAIALVGTALLGALLAGVVMRRERKRERG